MRFKYRKAAALNWAVYRLAKFTRKIPKNPMWKVGIYQPARLGDFVLSLAMIRSVIRVAGAHNCVLFHSVVSAEIAALEFPDVARIQIPTLHGKLWVTWRNLKLPEFVGQIAPGVRDLLCLRHFRALFDEVTLQQIPAQQVWCVGNALLNRLDYELVRRRFAGEVTVPRPVWRAGNQFCEDLQCHRVLLQAWRGGAVALEEILPRINCSVSNRVNFFAISPFGSAPIRDIPFEVLLSAIQYVGYKLELPAMLLAPAHEVPRYEELARRLRVNGAMVTVKVTPGVGDLIKTLAGCALVLTTETATAHLATALNLPMVCILGGGHYGCFAPWRSSPRQIWLNEPLDCYGCNWECVHPEPFCISRITPSRVVEALEKARSLSSDSVKCD